MKAAGFWQESDGSFSIRRLLATFFALCFLALSIMAILSPSAGWYVYIPALASLIAVIVILFFTTWSDIKAVVEAIK